MMNFFQCSNFYLIAMDALLLQFKQNVEKRLRNESELYLTEKQKKDIPNYSVKRIKLSLIDEPVVLCGVIGLSFVFDKFKGVNYKIMLKNMVLRLLEVNVIYYLVFTDYDQFYKTLYKKLIYKH
jgi:hypothetical protein